MHSLRIVAASVAFTFVSTPASARSTAGVAYDSVTKPVATSEPQFRSEDFAADFRAGQHPSQSCIPSVIRRYVTTRKERIDDVCKQEATIVDCKARTATWLDIANKNYRVISLDAKHVDFAAYAPARIAGMTSTIAIERTALGRKNVGGFLTDAYTASDEQSIVSSDSSVRSRNRWSYFFAPTPLPALACIDVAAPWLSRYGTPQRYEPELQRYFEAWRRAKSRGSGFLVSESGPELPSWRIVLYSVWQRFQRQSGAADSNYFFKLESGNIRSIDDADPAFAPPAKFTKIPNNREAR